jgi:pimeloyl-ACP methyl ester carboxylesterase
MSLAFHVAYPQQVKALILQGRGPGYRNAEARATWNARAEQRARTLETQGLSMLGGGSEVRISTQRSALGLAKAARGILAQVDARVIDSLPGIGVPTLIIVGEGDTPFVNGAHYMASRIPHATEVVVKHAAHGANVDQPEVVNQAIQAFLDTL